MWAKFAASFHDSETILIARIKMFIGIAFTAMQMSGIDLASLVTDSPRVQAAIKVFIAYLVVDGSVSEWARRNRATDLDAPRDIKDDHLDVGKP
jgi:uncharacterized membrane protein